MIFGAIAIAWLAYLVPHFVRRREEELVVDETDPAARFSESMRVVRHGTAPLLNQDLSPIAQYEVSTPLTRRAAIHELRRLEQVAASRRRRVLLVLLALLSAAVGVAAAGTLPWGLVAVPGALLLAFLTVARFSVRTMRRELDARFARIRQGSDTESTVRLSRKDLAAATSAPCQGRHGDLVDRRPVGPGPDHGADLRLQAAGPAHRAHHRPVRSRRRQLGPAGRPGHRRRPRRRGPGEPARARGRRPAGRSRVSRGGQDGPPVVLSSGR